VFGVQSSDVSQGLITDGAVGMIVFLPAPTPGASNHLPSSEIFVITDVRFDTDQITLTWESEPGGVYEIQKKLDLNDPDWQTVTSLNGQAGTTSLSLSVETTNDCYYRVIRLD
jgi:hypothetical protein